MNFVPTQKELGQLVGSQSSLTLQGEEDAGDLTGRWRLTLRWTTADDSHRLRPLRLPGLNPRHAEQTPFPLTGQRPSTSHLMSGPHRSGCASQTGQCG
jgi:hypothetical protein